jgi:hypothetical protein
MSQWLQVQGVPMSQNLASQFVERNLVTADGILLEGERYALLFNHIVCPTHEYYFLVETFAETITIYQVIVQYTCSVTPSRRVLPTSFIEAANLLEPILVLNTLVAFHGQLLTGWPARVKANYFHDQLRDIRREYNKYFPSHGMRELSRMLRLCSWELPSEDSVP